MALPGELAWQNFEMVLKLSVACQFARYALRYGVGMNRLLG